MITIILISLLRLHSALNVDSYIADWYRWRNEGVSADPKNKSQISGIVRGYTSFLFLGDGRNTTSYDPVGKPMTQPFILTFHEESSPEFIANMVFNKITVMLAIGGWTHKTRGFSEMIRSEDKINIFKQSALEMLMSTKATGLDFDWEYPGDVEREAMSDDIKYYAPFLKNVKDYLKANKGDYKQHVTVGINPIHIGRGYNVTGLYEANDRVNLMTYDMYGNFPTYIIYHNSPWINTVQPTIGFSIRDAILNWAGDNPNFLSKTGVGLAAYGRGLMCPASGACELGEIGQLSYAQTPLSQQAGVMDYQELIFSLDNNKMEITGAYYDTEAHSVVVLLTFQGEKLIYTFDDAATACNKARLAKQMGVSNIFLWHYYADTNEGVVHKGADVGFNSEDICPDTNNGEYYEVPPFLWKYLNYTPTEGEEICYCDDETTTTTTPPQQTESPNEYDCKGGEFYYIEGHPDQYYWCTGPGTGVIMTCVEPLVFNGSGCGWP